MTRYSVQPRDRIDVKGFVFLSFAYSMGTNVGKNISKKLRGKYSQNCPDHAKKSATDAVKTSSKRVIQKTAEATGDLIGNKIANNITRVSKNLQQNNSVLIQRQLEMSMLKKYFKKDIYLQKKDKKLLMN